MNVREMVKIIWWKVRGLSDEQIVQNMMYGGSTQELAKRLYLALRENKIPVEELNRISEGAAKNPFEAAKTLKEFLNKVK